MDKFLVKRPKVQNDEATNSILLIIFYLGARPWSCKKGLAYVAGSLYESNNFIKELIKTEKRIIHFKANRDDVLGILADRDAFSFRKWSYYATVFYGSFTYVKIGPYSSCRPT
jgi:hypothetical protein